MDEWVWEARMADDAFIAEVAGMDPGPEDGQGVCPVSAFGAAMGDLETATHFAPVHVASQWRIIAEVLQEAVEVPDPWVGPDPTRDPLWEDLRGRGVAVVRAERRDIAARAAAADIEVRLQLSETTVRTRAHHADLLRQRCPRVWKAFLSGDVPEQNATITAQLALSLPGDDPDVWAVFDQRVLGVAGRCAPGRFRTRARGIRERVHTESIDTRHRRAVADRGVWVTPELDGMATLTALLPAPAAHTLMGRLDTAARHLHTATGEHRTLAQLRADVLTDLAPPVTRWALRAGPRQGTAKATPETAAAATDAAERSARAG